MSYKTGEGNRELLPFPTPIIFSSFKRESSFIPVYTPPFK